MRYVFLTIVCLSLFMNGCAENHKLIREGQTDMLTCVDKMLEQDLSAKESYEMCRRIYGD